MVAMLCTYLLGDEPVHLIDMISRPAADGTAEVRQSWTMAFTPGRRFGPDKPVFVLTSGTTFSGGEELAYDLAQLGRATVVGERTRGGAHPVERFRIRAHLQATIPVARSLSPVSGGNWEGTGVLPDVAVPAVEALDAAYQRALAHVLSLGDGGARAETAAEARRAQDVSSPDSRVQGQGVRAADPASPPVTCHACEASGGCHPCPRAGPRNGHGSRQLRPAPRTCSSSCLIVSTSRRKGARREGCGAAAAVPRGSFWVGGRRAEPTYGSSESAAGSRPVSGAPLVADRGRAGNAASAMMTPTRPAAAPMASPRSMPLMNATRAAWPSSAPVLPPTRAATPRAPPTDPRILPSTACGRWLGSQRASHPAGVPGGQHAADHRDPQRPADLHERAVSGGAHPGVSARHRSHVPRRSCTGWPARRRCPA